MFKQAADRPPHPDMATCEEMATFLSNTMPQYWSNKIEVHPSHLTILEIKARNRWFEAVKAVRTIRPPVSFREIQRPEVLQAFENLEGALDRVIHLISPVWQQEWRPVFRPGVRCPKPWYVMGFVIMGVAQGTLKECRGRAGSNRNSIAAKFTELAMARLGWRDERGGIIGREAIAKHYADWSKRADRNKRLDNDHEPPQGDLSP